MERRVGIASIPYAIQDRCTVPIHFDPVYVAAIVVGIILIPHRLQNAVLHRCVHIRLQLSGDRNTDFDQIHRITIYGSVWYPLLYVAFNFLLGFSDEAMTNRLKERRCQRARGYWDWP